MTNKKIIIIVAVAVVVLSIIFYLTYRAGKKAGDTSKVKPPKDVVGADLSQDRIDYLNGLAISLYNDMNGWNNTWNNSLYEEVGMLSDTELVALSNIYNFKYEKDSDETFKEWLLDENFSWDSFDLQSKVDQIISRLTNLGVA